MRYYIRHLHCFLVVLFFLFILLRLPIFAQDSVRLGDGQPGILDWSEHNKENFLRGIRIDTNKAIRIDPNKPDNYEPDNNKYLAKPIDTLKYLMDYKHDHTFHEPGDIDWAYIFGVNGNGFLLSLTADHLVNIIIIDPNGVEIINESYIEPILFTIDITGYYYLKLEPAAPRDKKVFSYTVRIDDLSPRHPDSGVYGRVVDEKKNGINGVVVSLTYAGDTFSGSIGGIRFIDIPPSLEGGWFFFGTLNAPASYALMINGNETITIDLLEREMRRTPDIEISGTEPPASPEDKLEDLNELYSDWEDIFGCDYPQWYNSDNDDLINLMEFLDGTDPSDPNSFDPNSIYTIEFKLDKGLSLFPFYLIDPYSVREIFGTNITGWWSAWDYNKEEHMWFYWDANSSVDPNSWYLDVNTKIMEGNFEMKDGKGYPLYFNAPGIFSQKFYVGKAYLTPGMNIAPIYIIPGSSYRSYQFLNDKGVGVKSLNRLKNSYVDTNTSTGTGKWESTYWFFDRPSGNNFNISSGEAYVIGIEDQFFPMILKYIDTGEYSQCKEL